MPETEGLNVKISADTTEVDKAADHIVQKTQSIAGTITKIVAGIGIIALLKKSADAFGEIEKATFAFQSAMEQMAVPQKTIDSLGEFAKQLEKLYGINEAGTLNALALLTRLTGSGQAIDKLKEAVAGMAVATGNSMEGVANIIARTMSIGLSSLTRYGIVATEEQKRVWDSFGNDMEKRAEFLADILNEKFGGALDAYGETAVAANERAKQAFQRTMATLGQQVLPIFTGLLTIIDKVSNALGGLGVVLGIVAAAWLAASVIEKAVMIAEGKEVDGLILKYLALGLAKLWAINPILAIAVGAIALAAIIGIIYGLTKAVQSIGAGTSGSLDTDTKAKDDDDKDKDKNKNDVTPIINNITINQDNLGDYNAKTQNINSTKTNVRTR